LFILKYNASHFLLKIKCLESILLVKAIRERREKPTIEKHEAAMQAMKIVDDKKLNDIKEDEEEEISAAMQAFETKVAARRVYHEAPNDVFKPIVLPLSDVDADGYGKGGSNALRLVSKRCMQVVESVATRLTCKGYADSLPLDVLKRCKRIEHIKCYDLNSLEGCPDGLKSLYIGYGELSSLYQHARSSIHLRLNIHLRYSTCPLYCLARSSRN
jgi:hypothetical protein